MKALFLAFMILLSQDLFAQTNRLHSEDDYKDSWAITFRGGYTSTVLQHSETSDNSSYSSSNRRIRVPDIKFGLSIIKEFFNPSTISVTATVFAGMSDSDAKSGGEGQSEFTEDLTGMHYGGGLSINYNTYAYGLKIQPYIGASFSQEEREFALTHASGAFALQTFHEITATLVEPGIGVRCFDADVNLMSYFQITTSNVLTETIKASGRVNQTDVEISSNTSFEREPWSFTMGFGYFF